MLHVWVEVSDDDGHTWTALEEHKTEIGPDYVTTHIESKTGQRFRFQAEKLKESALHDDLAFDFCCDGHHADSLGLELCDYGTLTLDGIRTSLTVLQPFILGSVIQKCIRIYLH